MESSSAPAEVAARRDPSAVRATQIGLLIASLGALLVIFHPFGIGVVGIFLAIGGTLLAAPGNLSRAWFITIALGAVLIGVSRLLADGGSETTGGWLAVIGSLTVLIGAVLGFPTRDEE